jgi:hypothetical protein
MKQQRHKGRSQSKMRALVIKGIVILLLIISGISAIAAASDEENQPVMVLQEMQFDMGKIFEQDTYNHVFIVKNTGKADLIINNVKPG